MTRKTSVGTFRSMLALLALAVVLALPIQAQSGPVTIESYGEGLYFGTDLAADGLYLQVRGPAGIRHSDHTPGTGLLFEPGPGAPDGLYHFEVVVRALLSPTALAALEEARATGDRQVVERLRAQGEWNEIEPVSGSFRLQHGAIVGVVNDVEEAAEERSHEIGDSATESHDWQGSSNKDEMVADDLIVDGSACLGDDCTSGIGFGEDTLRLKEYNTRIHFQDISGGTYPSNDWRLKANSTSSGGANFFGLVDVDAGRTPFRVDAGAPTNALRVDDTGNVGFGTSTPAKSLHVTSNDTPTLRLDQSAAGGGHPQTWDLGGSDGGFTVQDVTGGTTPFEIEAGAPGSALVVDKEGQIGLGTSAPGGDLHLASDEDPTLRLEEKTSGRFWDVGGTTSHFFIRDSFNQNQVPFRILVDAEHGTLAVRPDGQVDIGDPAGVTLLTEGKLGIQTEEPLAPIHVVHDGGADSDSDGRTEELAIFENRGGMHLSLVRPSGDDWRIGANDSYNFFLQVESSTQPQLELDNHGSLWIAGDLYYGTNRTKLDQVISALEARIAALEAEVASHHP